ncbi:MAG: phenylalanine--tRNA ligase subunit alpha [Nanoarchaeota archaeon]|nr:phenylalanine--tRNA ligase subunit alpha [Nanoarchaeota archaeon]
MKDKEIQNMLESLTGPEIAVLLAMKSKSDFLDIVNSANLEEIKVMRALQWLSNKGLVVLKEDLSEVIELDINGKKYLKDGLPEKRFLAAIANMELSMADIAGKLGFDSNEVNICIGTLKKKAAIDIRKENGLIFSITEPGKKYLAKESLEEKFLKKDFPVALKSLTDEERFAFNELVRRKEIIRKNLLKHKSAELTMQGKKIADMDLKAKKVIDRLTPEDIHSGAWKNKSFRRFDVTAKVPKIYGGRRHFTRQAVEYIKKIWLELGFTEMSGTIVQSSFWDLDALFVPQDHPAREMQDTFYLKDPAKGKLTDKELVKRVKATHENGWTTGSMGWQTKWSEEKAKENLLRTHTTVLSAQTISKLKKEDLPAKFFSVNKNFRNESLDWKHLFEFYQVEGIVVDPDVNLCHHIGYLKDFFRKMGFPDARVKPSHFPYTEPSAEVSVFHPVRKEWVELGGSGVFRPEVVKPILGFECPVLAWGLGLDRQIMEYWGLSDIRDLYRNDLKQIKDLKLWMR